MAIWWRRSVRVCLQTTMLAVTSNQPMIDPSTTRTAVRRRYASRKTSAVTSSASGTDLTNRRLCPKTRSRCRSKIAPNASESSLTARTHVPGSDGSECVVVTTHNVRSRDFVPSLRDGNCKVDPDQEGNCPGVTHGGRPVSAGVRPVRLRRWRTSRRRSRWTASRWPWHRQTQVEEWPWTRTHSSFLIDLPTQELAT
jgi:hypothetical protein